MSDQPHPAADLHARLRQLAREVAALVERGDPATAALAELARLAEASGAWVAALREGAGPAGGNEETRAAAEECLAETIQQLLAARQEATVLLREWGRELDGAARAQRATRTYKALAPR